MNTWHRVRRKDQQRIRCMKCDKSAKVCEHVNWDTGNAKGISFFYMCLQHGTEHGFSTKKVLP